jgi:hypothetical protein
MMLHRDGRTLRHELLALMEGGADRTLDDRGFDELARHVFAYNFHHVPAYGAYCRARGRSPEDVRSWIDIPAVPTAAFKEVALVADVAEPERTFRTSGTTRGPERRGEHHVADLALYRASLRPTFRAFLLPDGARLPFLSLVPPAEASPDSSLAFMVEDVCLHLGAEGTAVFADARGIDFDSLDRAAARAVETAQPVLLLGTSAAFIHWLDRLAQRDTRFALPPGSRLMDTGGFKGAGREFTPSELRKTYLDRLGLPPGWCVNEYGMTEMLSQLYDTGLRDAVAGKSGPSRKQGPPWLRSLAADPETLEPLPPGRQGLLRHVDLANLGSVAAVQTEDVGLVDEHGLVLEGRSPGAQPRGCSIAMDLILGGAP